MQYRRGRKDLTERRCHNEACAKLYMPVRVNQKHCDRICGDRCRLCHHVYELAYYKRLKMKKKRVQRGRKIPESALKLVQALEVNRG